MQIAPNLHLAYCTNIHPAETWTETFHALETDTLRVRDRVSAGRPFAIGLRLSDIASRELMQPSTLDRFRAWLHQNNCYIFTINGFPFGRFHHTRVKENVYRPDWTTDARTDYTIRLFQILAALLPEGVEGSVSTLPGSFKTFQASEPAMFANIWRCARAMAETTQKSGRVLHLGFEPEPLGHFETTQETAAFFEKLRNHPEAEEALFPLLGVNYDTCHLAIEFENPMQAIACLQQHSIRISKIHLSSAIRTGITAAALQELKAFQEETYLHQLVARRASGELRRYTDLPEALADPLLREFSEARVHFHVPLHWKPQGALQSTIAHAREVLELATGNPGLCSHLEIETYTWSVLPENLRSPDVVDQIEREYRTVFDGLEASELG